MEWKNNRKDWPKTKIKCYDEAYCRSFKRSSTPFVVIASSNKTVDLAYFTSDNDGYSGWMAYGLNNPSEIINNIEFYNEVISVNFIPDAWIELSTNLLKVMEGH